MNFQVLSNTATNNGLPEVYRGSRVLICALLSVAMFLAGCRSGERLANSSSKTYGAFVSAFYVGLAALQVGDDVRAERSLAEAVKLVPAEPAGWANWGILALRQRSYDAAAQRLEQARALVPKNDRIYYLLGLLESERGDPAKAIVNLREAVRINPENLRATYQLASEVERQADQTSDADFEGLIKRILFAEPENLAALLELTRIAAKRGDGELLRSTVNKITAQSSAWPADVKEQLARLQAAAAGGDPHLA
ncbi:MAG: tetratricopeptide repeat protein, partial [Acidobacteriaceae bacterium]